MDLFNVNETERPLAEANINGSTSHLKSNINYLDIMDIVQLSVAPVGIIGNLAVIVVFLSHRQLRKKIPNRFIVNQVRISLILSSVVSSFFVTKWDDVMHFCRLTYESGKQGMALKVGRKGDA